MPFFRKFLRSSFIRVTTARKNIESKIKLLYNKKRTTTVDILNMFNMISVF